MTVEIRELLIQAKVVPSTRPTESERQNHSLIQESLDEATWVETIKREVLAALRDEEGWRP
ncbi:MULTISPECIES: DUF5908 family protein [Photorhabdus]|uniref:Uncharacterized protein n=3 Tax=Photorhabdus TaxID=29487 RepID=B6VNN9_PHOAA|nr:MULTISPECIES: DUF5908 family protein [Photorhabdus]CAR67770.1 Hypothetical Protein PA-RVA20-21-0166 [Photorhabdus asymbiotica subsp. asymbiotica ATCC 43949]NRN29493.1 hypothetical protein [Photorhabdus heterorhabditis subsp. aluminescens]OCQ52497.1 hypothetical protein Ppb6_02233 [Photorhabdus australis subsp. thailandensis]RKS59304.1 hypothetical protein BDD30_1370 [Photorhabdus asymbiotica]CAQ85436.1 conserved hypothetical protein [Photorhabdus asymbiotica]